MGEDLQMIQKILVLTFLTVMMREEMLISIVRTTADSLQEMTAGCLTLSPMPPPLRRAAPWPWLAPPSSARRCLPHQVPAPVLKLHLLRVAVVLLAGQAGRTSWQSSGCR